ncbi:MAG: SpoIID/LytB domain-containing protein [Eubacteriales bacterium]
MSKANKRETAKKLALRIVAGIMAALMLISVIYMAIVFTIGVHALPLDSYEFETVTTSDDFRIAVGIRYGSSASPLHSFTSPNGFVVGESQILKTERGYEPLYTIDETDIAAVVDANLKIGYQTCEIATTEADTDIGGYHVELSVTDGNAWNNLSDLSAIFADYGHVFAAYIDGARVVRIGAFANYSDANAAAAAVGAQLEGFNVSVASPTSASVCFLNSDYDTILFEYSGAENFYAGITAVQIDGAEKSYLKYAGTGQLYDGVFCFKRYLSSSNNGLTLINLVGLQSYIEGVLPNEIIPSWPAEAQKAFALMARSFVMANLNRHNKAYGFDVCASSCCQVYQGRKNVTQNVMDAVAATKNQIMTYEGSIVNAAYSSSQGGYTVGSQYVWLSSLGYLPNQATPWEDYYSVGYATWQKEITPQELAACFKNRGYSAIKGNEIVDISYNTADDSPYIYSFTGVDEYGNTATATKCSSVTTLLYQYVRSANFTIAKGELTYCYTDVLENRVINLNGGSSGEVSVYTSDGIKKTDVSSLSFFTDLGTALKDAANALFVKTEEGTATITGADVDIPVSTMPDENGYYTVVSNFGDFLIVSEVQDIYQTITASSPDNYVIAGMGYGHGVGASQYGILHLAKAGATYDQILRAYYHNITIESTHDYFQ